DHDFGDALVAQERLEGTETDDLVRDLLEHPNALGAGEGEALFVDDLAEDLFDLAADLDLVGQVQLRVQVLDDAALDPELDVAERLPNGSRGHQSWRRRGRSTGRRRRQRAGTRRPPRGSRTRRGPGPRSSTFDSLEKG